MNAVSLTRRIIVWVVIVSFGVAAVGGISVLLGARLGEPAYRVLSTTAVVGVFSIAVLCCASLLGRSLRAFGLVGVAVSLVTLALAVYLIWASDVSFADWTYRVLWTGAAATTAFSLASLLLLLADRRRLAVRIGLFVTLGLFVLVLAMVVFVIWAPEYDSDIVSRVLGILSILAALGAIVVPVLSLLLPDAKTAPSTAELSPPVLERVRAEADRRGMSADQLVTELLDRDRPA